MSKNRKFLFIFLIILVVILVFFILSNTIFAEEEEIELKNEYSTKIWQVVKQGISDEITEITTSSDFKIEEQAALVIIKQAIKADIAHYLFIDVPKEVAKSVINATIKLAYSILARDPSIIIGEIEKLSVEKAKEYAMDWLLQNEIKTSSGNLEISYSTYKGDWEKAILPYTIVYHPLGPKQGKVGINIYSSKVIKTPFPSRNFQWEGGIEELEPFIVRINGELEYVDDVYRWIKEPQIEVVFDEPVPEIEFKEAGFFDKLKSYLDKTKKAFDNLLDLIGIFSSKLNIFQATVGPSPTPVPPDLPSDWQEDEVEEIGEKIEKVEESGETGSPSKLELEELQEILDDIAERIDILSQKVAELVGESEGIGGPIEPIEGLEEEETEGEELVEREELEDKKTAVCFVEINAAPKEELQKITGVGTVIAQRIIDARPFSSIYDLIRVNGIGEITLQKIIEQGCVYVEHPTGGGGGGGGGSSSTSPTYPKILISEIQILPIEEKFVELYNPNNQTIDLTSWYIQRKTQTGSSWDSFISSTKFEGKTIQPYGYFLIAKLAENTDIVFGLTLTENNTLVLKNPNREIVDEVGWGEAQEFELAPTINPPVGKSIGRKWIDGAYQDNDNNQDDFEVQEPSPKTENSKPLLPQPILEVSLQSLEFSIVEFTTPSQSQTFTISNSGEGSLEWQGIIEYTSPSDANWLKIEPDSGTAPSEVSVSLSQDIFSLGKGNFEAEIVISAEGTKGSPKKIGVELEVETKPEPELEQPLLTVVINEIGWMGTKANSSDEWIEFYNPNPEPIEMADWQLLFYPLGNPEPRTNTFSVLDTTTPAVNGFSYFLLERTNDEPISDIKADYIFKGALNDDGGVLELRDGQGNLVDKVDCSGGQWFAGDKEKKISMERIDAENWANNNLIMRQGRDAKENSIWGTPKSKNSVSTSPTEIAVPLPFDEFDEITLTFLNSPYIIRWTLDVPQDKILNIEPGVIVKFYENNSGLTVMGTLKAIGTENEKIIFTSLSDNPQPGSWDQIYFDPTSTDSEMINVIVRYGGGRYIIETICPWENAGIRVDQSSIVLENSIIEYNKRKGVWLNNSSSRIENVQFIGQVLCKGYFGEYEGTGLAIDRGDSVVRNSVFKRNVYGISISNVEPILESLVFGQGEEANQCNILKDGKCIDPTP